MLASQADISTDESPPLSPAEAPLDLAHLFRMTLGDSKLEREVLTLFDRQLDLLIARMDAQSHATAAAVAHTLCGSARGIGAWRVARAAEDVERVALGRGDLEDRISSLRDAACEAHAAIAVLLHRG